MFAPGIFFVGTWGRPQSSVVRSHGFSACFSSCVQGFGNLATFALGSEGPPQLLWVRWVSLFRWFEVLSFLTVRGGMR